MQNSKGPCHSNEVGLYANSSCSLNAESVYYSICVLAKLSLDRYVAEDCEVYLSIIDAFAALLSSIPEADFDDMVSLALTGHGQRHQG